MEWIIAAVAGIFIGYLFSFLVAKGQKQVLVSKLEMLQNLLDSEKHQSEETVKELNRRLESVKEETRLIVEQMKEEEQKKVADIKMESQKQTEYALKIQQERFDETIAKVTAQLKSATDEMLKQRQKEFAESSHVNIGQIVNPLRETIDKMKVVMNDSTLKQTAMTSEMKVNIENMMRQSQAAKQSADELARVFKHRSKVQGDWGETVLAELLDSQGLTKGVHYDVQSVIKDAEGYVVKSMEGSIMRPDVILHLDQRREVIIDSKVSLTSFMDYVNAEDEDVRQMHLKAHIDSIQKHVKELSAKDYSSYVQAPKVKMDYVIMFVPHTGALWTALHSQPDLWRKAMDKNVFIADEQTLFAALRIINLTWTQIAQAQNHEKVYALANEMLDRVGQFMKKYQAIGKALENATKAYEDGEKKLLPGGQSILQTCGKLEKLGAKQSDKNPLPQLIDLDEIPTIE
jgi:DNA recombination protein RmuC